LIQLRSGHIQLNKHLHRINKTESPLCAHHDCDNKEETVTHFILHCPRYREQRRALLQATKNKARDIYKLLSRKDCLPHLYRYINSTKRLYHIFGEIRIPRFEVN
ncbi:hypothetical protein BD779DRAFT_1649873, partial [Infundibulicybe gibba]